MNDEPQADPFLDIYDDLACAVLDDTQPNYRIGTELSNAEMVREICELMDWDEFDLLSPIDFQAVFDTGDEKTVTAHMFINHLRMDLFWSASMNGIGDFLVNKHASVFSEYWFRKLSDRLKSMETGEEIRHEWLH